MATLPPLSIDAAWVSLERVPTQRNDSINPCNSWLCWMVIKPAIRSGCTRLYTHPHGGMLIQVADHIRSVCRDSVFAEKEDSSVWLFILIMCTDIQQNFFDEKIRPDNHNAQSCRVRQTIQNAMQQAYDLVNWCPTKGSHLNSWKCEVQLPYCCKRASNWYPTNEPVCRIDALNRQ